MGAAGCGRGFVCGKSAGNCSAWVCTRTRIPCAACSTNSTLPCTPTARAFVRRVPNAIGSFFTSTSSDAASAKSRRPSIISVDTKKRELVGYFKNPGQVWSREPIQVHDHDFPSLGQGVAIPYGVYDVQANRGCVTVGTSRNTPAFAAASISDWWLHHGRHRYPEASRLLILADNGGSNGADTFLWKHALQQKLVDPFGLFVTVCHYPTGASKWNPIEHRLFAEISKQWAGQPLANYPTVLRLIRTTRTRTGLAISCSLDTRQYPIWRMVFMPWPPSRLWLVGILEARDHRLG